MQIWFATLQTMQAAETSVLLPATFVKITSLSNISANSTYLIAGVSNQENRVSFLSASYYGKTNYLKAILNEEGATESYSCNENSILWRITPNTDGTFTIQSEQTEQYITYIDAEKTDLVLANNSESTTCKWFIVSNNDGTFAIRPKQNSNRGICSQFYTQAYTDRFGNYLNPQSLYLYKLNEDFGNTSGQALRPTDGSKVAIGWGDNLWTSKATHVADATNLILSNGDVAQDDNYTPLICRYESGTTFTLTDEATQRYLSADLTLTTEKTTWQVTNGYITTTTPDGTLRTLCYAPKQNAWKMLTTDEATKQNANGALFYPIAAAAQIQTNTQGVTTLSGGWSATKLATLDWTGTKCLDLTHISLPKHLLPYTNTPETQNLPIFVAKAASATIPADWNFVVACGSNANELLRTTELADKDPFFTDRPIHVAKGILTYKRHVSQEIKWQTLCLPFGTETTPKDFTTYEFSELNGNEVNLTPVSSLKSGTAYVLYLNDDAGNSPYNAWTLSNVECTLTTSIPSKATMYGTYEKIQFSNSAEQTYMLHAASNTFRLAANGSTLPPFRAALQLTNEALQKAKTAATQSGTTPKRLKLNISHANNVSHK